MARWIYNPHSPKYPYMVLPYYRAQFEDKVNEYLQQEYLFEHAEFMAVEWIKQQPLPPVIEEDNQQPNAE